MIYKVRYSSWALDIQERMLMLIQNFDLLKIYVMKMVFYLLKIMFAVNRHHYMKQLIIMISKLSRKDIDVNFKFFDHYKDLLEVDKYRR